MATEKQRVTAIKNLTRGNKKAMASTRKKARAGTPTASSRKKSTSGETAKSSTAKKKSPAKKTTANKTAAKKSTAKKATAKKSTSKKAPSKKPAVGKLRKAGVGRRKAVGEKGAAVKPSRKKR